MYNNGKHLYFRTIHRLTTFSLERGEECFEHTCAYSLSLCSLHKVNVHV